MKKVLLAGTALLGVAFLASPAAAELNLDLGGYMRGYGVYADNDEPAAASLREFEFRRDTEIHFTGETTLDNGLTVGFHNEMNIEANDLEDESYAYFSGGWGRVNFGSEDGAAYLLQVAAPSADSNVDGLRAYIDGGANIFSAAATFGALTNGFAGLNGNTLIDYDHADFRQTDRLTYMTPKFNGFQAGVSYAPNAGQQVGTAALTPDNNAGQYEDLWEVAARWDGEFSGFGLSLGAGYSQADAEAIAAPAAGVVSDDLDTWNVGASLGWNSFTLGAAYLTSETAQFTGVGAAEADLDKDTYVVGAAWDNGPYHVGASYLNTEYDRGSVTAAIDANYEQDRWTVGAGYTYGPGMTFRGAVAVSDNDVSGTGVGSAIDNDTTQVTIGTDIQF